MKVYIFLIMYNKKQRSRSTALIWFTEDKNVSNSTRKWQQMGSHPDAEVLDEIQTKSFAPSL